MLGWIVQLQPTQVSHLEVCCQPACKCLLCRKQQHNLLCVQRGNECPHAGDGQAIHAVQPADEVDIRPAPGYISTASMPL
jgi:hypothetical protein